MIDDLVDTYPMPDLVDTDPLPDPIDPELSPMVRPEPFSARFQRLESFIHMNGLVSQLTAEVGQLNDNDRDVRPLVNEVHRTNVRSRVLHTLMVQWSWLVFDTGSYSDGVPSD